MRPVFEALTGVDATVFCIKPDASLPNSRFALFYFRLVDIACTV